MRPPKNAPKAQKVAAYQRQKAYLLENKDRLFPAGGTAPCERHPGRMCPEQNIGSQLGLLFSCSYFNTCARARM